MSTTSHHGWDSKGSTNQSPMLAIESSETARMKNS